MEYNLEDIKRATENVQIPYKILINKKKEHIEVFVFHNDCLVEEYSERFDEQRLESNVYLGKVNNILPGMQVAFIDVGTDKKAIIHLKDCIPKQSSITGNENIDITKYDIRKIIKPNQNIIVQIKRDCNRNKGPIVTKDIKIVGKYIILMPFSKFITTSKKIEKKEEKERLIDCVEKELKEYGFGAIIRTSSIEKSKEIIINDINELITKWKEIVSKSEQSEAPIELYNNNGIIGKLINDFEPLGVECVTNSEEIAKYIHSIDDKIKVNIEDLLYPELEESRKIWLKSGGFITIDNTEALVAIDVNSGKSTGKTTGKTNNTALDVNCEAVSEIARQIRLRDLGGIIIIDFIDMNNDEKEIVLKKMEEEIKKDRSKVQISEFTKLGLLELTRKHILGR